MGFYRNIDGRTWGDGKFRELSRAEPNAQTLWLYLLTGEHVGPLPGIFILGIAALAEALDWPLEATRECFQELADQGMAEADWRSRVVWLPNGARHNEPANPNVVQGWFKYLDQIPECALKTRAIHGLKTYLETRGARYSERFVERFAEPLGKPLPEPWISDPDPGLANRIGTRNGTRNGRGRGSAEGASLLAAAPPSPGSTDLVLLPGPTPEELQVAWNERAPPLPRWQDLTPKRTTSAKARIRERGLEGPNGFRAVIARIVASPFCLGENDRGWKASPDWLLQPDTATKVLEGKYDPPSDETKGDASRPVEPAYRPFRDRP